jgi:hypothetical protein
MTYLELINNKLDNQQISNNKVSLITIEGQFKKILELRNVCDFEYITQKEFEIILEKLKYLVKKLSCQVEKVFEQLRNNDENIKLLHFMNNLRLLNELKWSENYIKNIYLYTQMEINENLLDFLEIQEKNLKYLDINIEQKKDIEITYYYWDGSGT